MLTMTTYGTWLRGCPGGWVEDGRVFPPEPALQAYDRRRMKHPPFFFGVHQLVDIGEAIGSALQDRLRLRIGAMAVQTWHVHVLLGAGPHPVATLAKCTKDAVRWHLRVGRPVWGSGYDKRFCFDWASVKARIAYIERHNVEIGLPAKPWGFIEDLVRGRSFLS